MSSSTTGWDTTHTPGSVGGGARGGNGREPTPGWRDGGRRRRSVPHLLLGLLLVLACVVAFLVVSLTTGDRRPVLALARSVTVGQVLSVQDLRQVEVAVDAGVGVVPADQAAAVVGRSMATSLPAGALLPPDAVGAAAMVPAAGQAIVALALKSGQLPVEVAAGARVSVVLVPTQPSTGGAADGPGEGGAPGRSRAWPAVVTSVSVPPNEQVTVVSVQLAEAAAGEVAAVPVGQLSVVMLAGGGR